MIKKLFFLFIFFAPFTSFFAFSAWMRLPVIINQVLFVFLILSVLIHGKLKNKWILKEDILLIFLLVWIWLSFVLGFKEQRSFNHSLAYTNCIIFYFFLSKYVIQLLNIKGIEIAAVIYKSFIFFSFIIILDFVAINYFDFSIRRLYSPIVDHAVSNMHYYIRDGFFRVGGVAEEPGSMAHFYNIYLGISFFYIYEKREFKKFKWIVLLVIISHFALYSNAGIALAVMALVLIFCFNKLKKLSISKKQLSWFAAFFLISAIIVPIVFFNSNSNNFEKLEAFVNKISFSEDQNQYSSSGARLNQWSRAISNFIKHPIFGNGPGYGVNEDTEGYLSVYLTILSDLGVLAFIMFISFQVVLVLKIYKLNGFVRDCLFFSAFTSFLHLIIIADFYQAPVWILFLFIQIIYKETKSNLL